MKRAVKFKFEEELKQLGVLEQFETNIKLGLEMFNVDATIDTVVKSMNIDSKSQTFEGFVSIAFPWHLMSEGYEFWQKISLTEF